VNARKKRQHIPLKVLETTRAAIFTPSEFAINGYPNILKDNISLPEPKKKKITTAPANANPNGAVNILRYNFKGVLPRNTVAILIDSAINNGVTGEVDDTPTSNPKATIISLSQLFLYLKGLINA
jgi:hypothetical protein